MLNRNSRSLLRSMYSGSPSTARIAASAFAGRQLQLSIHSQLRSTTISTSVGVWCSITTSRSHSPRSHSLHSASFNSDLLAIVRHHWSRLVHVTEAATVLRHSQLESMAHKARALFKLGVVEVAEVLACGALRNVRPRVFRQDP